MDNTELYVIVYLGDRNFHYINYKLSFGLRLLEKRSKHIDCPDILDLKFNSKESQTKTPIVNDIELAVHTSCYTKAINVIIIISNHRL